MGDERANGEEDGANGERIERRKTQNQTHQNRGARD